MNALEAIRTALKFTDMGMVHLGSMADAPLLRPGPWGGNHAMWIAGHLAVVEGRLHQMLSGGPNPLARWKPLFDWGSEPADDPSAYPPFAEVMDAFRAMRKQTHAFLDEVERTGIEGLDRPVKSQPSGFTGMETAGRAALVVACHAIGHMGGLTVVRAASGKERLFVPSEALRAY